MAISIDDALKTLLLAAPASARAHRAMLYDLMCRVDDFHGCRWLGVVGTGDEELYDLAEQHAEQSLGVVYEPLDAPICLSIDIIARGDLGFGTPDGEESARLTLLFEDDDDDWTKTTVAADVYDELDLSLEEAWEQLGHRPVLAVFWDG